MPGGKLNDLYVESCRTGQGGHIEVKTGVAVVKDDFPVTKDPFLVITPWETRKGKKIQIGKSEVSIPLGEAQRVRKVLKELGTNYAVLAGEDRAFDQKLEAWIDSGKLERVLNDPAHGSKRGKKPTKTKQRG
ncbi:MAG: hypothetical protein ACFFGZ_18175 [Candidatus Thorarchaeota archaeon]